MAPLSLRAPSHNDNVTDNDDVTDYDDATDNDDVTVSLSCYDWSCTCEVVVVLWSCEPPVVSLRKRETLLEQTFPLRLAWPGLDFSSPAQTGALEIFSV